jgi:zinc protease
MRLRVALVAWLFLAFATGSATAQPSIALNYETYTLDNGLQVILVEDHSAPVVAVDIWYHVGGANDPDGRSGFAHLFEHMMFQGTANLTKEELQRLVDDAGGSYNAYTALDQTAFHETLPAHELPLGLWLEADRMASLAVTQTNLDNQRAVVIQEYEQNYGGAPYGLALKDFYSLTYSYEPYRRASIGAVDDLNAATVPEITDFHSTYYVPNNATLVVAGDFDPTTARDLVAQYFDPIPRGAAPPQPPEWVPQTQTEAQVYDIQDSLIRIPATLIGYEIPPPRDEDSPALAVLAAILGTGDSSRLSRDFIDTGDALVANAFVQTNAGPGLFGVILLPGTASRDDLEQQFQDELDQIVNDGVSQDEIDKAVALIRSQRIASMETALGVAEEVQQGNGYYDDPAGTISELDLIAAVTVEDIQRVAATYLAPEERHIYRVNVGEPQPFVEPVPYVGATGTPADDEFQVDFALPFTDPPAPLPVTTLNFPPITEVTLPNGLDVVVIEKPELPVLSLDLVFRGGQSLVPDGEPPAVADIAAQLITRGTTSKTAQQIANTIESKGGVTGAYSGDDLIGFGIFSLIENRDLAFDLLADMAFNPVFSEDELSVQLGQLQGGLQAALGDASAQASRAFNPVVYGAHPYGAITTMDDLGAITRDAIVAYYNRVSRPDNALLIIAGRITSDEALALAEERFGDWQASGPPPEPAFPAVAEPASPQPTILVDVPGAQQAAVLIGNLAVHGDNPDRYALAVANAVLGQGLSSRLNRLVREQLGYTYGVRSRLTLPVDVGTFQVVASVQASTIVEAISSIVAEVERLRSEPIDDSELTAVRDGMIGRFALGLETYQDFVNSISSYWIRGLPLDDIAQYPALIGAVTPATALDAAERFLPENLDVVVAGDADVLEPLLEAAGPVTVIEAH